ncbi:hypothetical protein BHM03_00001369 [Ensete ventricosum]|nr:hypothetical protein BHM03_00001369 [Ensete ventricosum]
MLWLDEVPSFPKYTSSTAQRNLKSHTQDSLILFWQPYIDLANCYATGTFSELEGCIQTNLEKFQADSNLGLVKQVLSSLYKGNIQRLTQTYLTLSLQDIANAAQLKTPREAEMHVLQMCFIGRRLMALSKKLGSLDEHMSCDPAYLTRVSFTILLPLTCWLLTGSFMVCR